MPRVGRAGSNGPSSSTASPSSRTARRSGGDGATCSTRPPRSPRRAPRTSSRCPVALRHGNGQHAEHPAEHAVTELERLVELRSTRAVGLPERAPRTRLRASSSAGSRTPSSAAIPGASAVAEAVARNLFKLMAYKDEYEVARLTLDPALGDIAPRRSSPTAAACTTGCTRPLLRAMGMRRKLALGRWSRAAFRMLRGMRRLRGTPFDPFGHTKCPAHRARAGRRVPRARREGAGRALARHVRPRRPARRAPRRRPRLRGDQAPQRRRVPRAGPRPRLLTHQLFLARSARLFAAQRAKNDEGVRRWGCRRRPRGRARRWRPRAS